MSTDTVTTLFERFLQARGWTMSHLEHWSAPLCTDQLLLDLDYTANEITRLIKTDKRIVVLPDYDADGLLSGVVLSAGLTRLGAKVSLYAPDPTKGYGFNAATVDEIKAHYPDVFAIITCDTGITCNDGIVRMRELGIRSIVTDHHRENPDQLCLADLVVDPCRVDETWRLPGICGSHVAYLLMAELASRSSDLTVMEDIRQLRALAGVATITDSMPLVHENRILVRDAIRIINAEVGTCQWRGEPCHDAVVGLCELIRTDWSVREVDLEDVNATTFGFTVGPMLNCIKRLGKKTADIFPLFSNPDPAVRERICRWLIDLNAQRKALVRELLAGSQCIDTSLPYAWLLPDSNRGGVAGLVAMNLMTGENHGLPTMALGLKSDGSYHGSGRSPEGYPLMSRLRSIGVNASGHDGAFGVSFTDHVQLMEALAFIDRDLGNYVVDAASDPWDLDVSDLKNLDELWLLHRYLRSYGPWGVGMEPPMLAVRASATSLSWSNMGAAGQHSRATHHSGLELLAWNNSDPLKDVGSSDYVVWGWLDKSTYRDQTSLNLIVEGVQRA